jgi:hypothetical protein
VVVNRSIVTLARARDRVPSPDEPADVSHVTAISSGHALAGGMRRMVRQRIADFRIPLIRAYAGRGAKTRDFELLRTYLRETREHLRAAAVAAGASR